MSRAKKYRSVEQSIGTRPNGDVWVGESAVETPLTWEGSWLPPGGRTMTMRWWRRTNANYFRMERRDNNFIVVAPGIAFTTRTDTECHFTRLEEDPNA